MATIKKCRFCKTAQILWKSQLKTYVDMDDQNHKHRCDEMTEAFSTSNIEKLNAELTKSSSQHYDDKVNLETTLNKILSLQYKILDEIKYMKYNNNNNRKPFKINFDEPLIKEVGL